MKEKKYKVKDDELDAIRLAQELKKGKRGPSCPLPPNDFSSSSPLWGPLMYPIWPQKEICPKEKIRLTTSTFTTLPIFINSLLYKACKDYVYWYESEKNDVKIMGECYEALKKQIERCYK